MAELEELRALALAMPEAEEHPHFRLPAFRVRGAPFLVLQPGGWLLAHLDEPAVHEVAGSAGALCEVVKRGERLVGVRAELGALPADLLGRLVRTAWRARAPMRLRESAGDAVS